MKKWLQLWRDQRGEVTATAIILTTTILAIGAIVGLVVLRNQILQEFGDISAAMRNLDQSFSVNLCGDTRSYTDMNVGVLDPPTVNDPPAGIEIDVAPATPNTTPGEDAGP